MLFDGFDQFRLGGFAPVCHAKGAVIRMPAGPTGDLCCFRCRQPAHLATIKFHVSRKGHMIEIEVQPHADGIRRHQKINITILVQLNLRIACARAETSHDNGRPAPLAANKFGDLIDIGHPERDNGAAPRQARQLL